ncbi:MAG: restriction endonuclease [Patescibacteria group bacterium]
MHPSKFEDYIANMYSHPGYNTKRVGHSHDGGIDIIATKDGIEHYIQCKRYNATSTVGVSAIRDFYGAMADKLSKGKGMFITTNIFTTEAEKFAENNPIELVDGDGLLRLIKSAEKENEIIESKEANICPICGGKLREINGKFSKFMGCANYPKCKFTKKIVH